MPEFATPEPIDVTLDLAVGRLDIIASDRVDTVVTVAPTNRSKPADVTFAEQTRVEFADGRLRVANPKRWAMLGPGSESTDIRIELPSGSAVRGALAVGSIRVSGRIGDGELSTGMGDIAVAHGGRLALKASSGEITVGVAEGPVALTSSVGSVRADRLDAGGTIKNSTGSVHLGRLAGELRVSTATGSITVETVDGSLVAKTAHGKVRVLDAVRGSVRVEGGYGEVDVAVRPGTAAWLDVASQRGTVRNELAATGAPAAGEDTVELRARTSWGDITIHRTTASD